MIDRRHMITCDKKCTINLVSIAFAVSGNIDFFERTGIIHHSIVHVSTWNDHSGIVLAGNRWNRFQISGKIEFKLYKGFNKM